VFVELCVLQRYKCLWERSSSFSKHDFIHPPFQTEPIRQGFRLGLHARRAAGVVQLAGPSRVPRRWHLHVDACAGVREGGRATAQVVPIVRRRGDVVLPVSACRPMRWAQVRGPASHEARRDNLLESSFGDLDRQPTIPGRGLEQPPDRTLQRSSPFGFSAARSHRASRTPPETLRFLNSSCTGFPVCSDREAFHQGNASSVDARLRISTLPTDHFVCSSLREYKP
jgi:hypothetical protein